MNSWLQAPDFPIWDEEMKVSPGLYKLRDGRLVKVTRALTMPGFVATPLDDRYCGYAYWDDSGRFMLSGEHEWDLVHRVDLF